MLTVVSGPPCVGKTTYVREHARPGDIVIDYDALAVALGSPSSHDHPAPIAYVTRAARQTAVRAAIGCHRRGSRVWVIDTDPSPGRQAQYAKAGAITVALTAPAAELHRRAAAGRPKQWHTLIDRWVTTHATDHAEQPTAGGIRPW